MSHIRLCAAVVLFSAACARTETASDTSAAASAPDRAAAAARVANAIAARPTAADSILRANGYTAETFEQAMYDIAQDSAQSAAYAAARSRE